MERKLYPLLPMQRWLIDTHFEKAKSTMMNIGALFKLDPSIDTKRLADVINDILQYHDIFRCRLTVDPQSGDIRQHFDGKISPVIFMQMNEEQLELHLKYLKMPFDLIEAPLYRIYIITTDEGNYAYFDFYHAMFDGLTIGFLFRRELDMRYSGREFKRPAESFAECILERQKISPTEVERQSQYWYRMFDGFDPEQYLPPVDVEGVEGWSQNTVEHTLENINQTFFKGKSISANTFFIAATMLTVAKSAGQSDAKISWVHNGRMSMREQRLFALTIEQYPIAWDFKRDQTVDDFLSGLDEKINEGFQYREGLAAAYEDGLEDYCVSFILQKSTSIHADFNVKVGDAKMIAVELPPNDMSAVENALDVELDINDDDSYKLILDYDASRYSVRAMENFAASFDESSFAMQDGARMVSTILHGR